MQFKNPANGHVETVSGLSWLWALLFGPMYFLVCGLWAPWALFMLLAGIFWSTLGPPGTVLVIPTWIGFALAAGGLRRKGYLRKGWQPVGAGADQPAVAGVLEQPAEQLRACPFCAEAIKPQALKCKHCGSDVSATAVVPPGATA